MAQVKCPRCSALVPFAEGFTPVCPSCGYTTTAHAAAQGPGAATPATPMSPRPPPTGPTASAPSQGIAIVALLLNVLVWPGLGSLVGGRIGEGLAQGFLMLLGLLLTITLIFLFIGIPLMIGMWVWGLVTGIQLVNASNAGPRPGVVA